MAITVQSDQPLSSQALVIRPATIPGLRSWSIEPASHHGSGLVALTWNPRGDFIVTGYAGDNSIRLWDREGTSGAFSSDMRRMSCSSRSRRCSSISIQGEHAHGMDCRTDELLAFRWAGARRQFGGRHRCDRAP